MEKKLRILVVDDNEENRDLVEVYMARLGHSTISAENGEEAIDTFKREKPDLVLMDVMMPVMDGYEATRRIRQLCGNTWTPIIFLSANVSLDDQIQGIEAGGDDYLLKPINLRMLRTKVGAMQRIAAMQAQLNEYHAHAQDEMTLARRLVDSMTQHAGLNDPALNYWFESAEKLSGDLISACRTVDDKLHVMVADATGHGLAAAMSQLPVAQSFYEMTKSGHSIPSIVATINSKLTHMLTTERYVSGILASIDFNNRILEVWNGSGPDAYFVNQHGQILHTFSATECALGIIDDGSYRLQTQVYRWDEPGELIIYSDGLLDAANAKGEMFGDERLIQSLQNQNATGENRFDSVKHNIEGFYDKNNSFDDISLVSVKCDDAVETLQAVNG